VIYPFCPCAWITTGRSIHRAVRAAAAIAGEGLPPAPSPVAPPPAAPDDEYADDWGDLVRGKPADTGLLQDALHGFNPAGTRP